MQQTNLWLHLKLLSISQPFFCIQAYDRAILKAGRKDKTNFPPNTYGNGNGCDLGKPRMCLCWGAAMPVREF